METLIERMERSIFKHCVEELLASDRNFSLSLSDGGEVVVKNSRDAEEIIKASYTTGQDILSVFYTSEGRKGRGFVQFIYGNDGSDVIADYSCWLEPHIARTEALATAYELGEVEVPPLP
jgi:hypothetical protein